MTSIFKKGGNTAHTALSAMVEALNTNVGRQQIITPGIAKTGLGLESASESDFDALSRVASNLQHSIESLQSELGLAEKAFASQTAAAVTAGIFAGDFNTFLKRSTSVAAVSTESVGVVVGQVEDGMSERAFGIEAYDERENRNAVVYSIAYNYQAARQDEFGEAFFPTITLSPDQVGFGITVNLMQVWDGLERKVSGVLENFNKKNIIRAVADASVLKKEQTKVTPVHRPQSAAMFSTAVAPVALNIEGESINTAPLAFGKKIELIGVSQTEALLALGTMDQTDTLDPTVTLANVYAKFGDDVIRIPTLDLPLSNFVYGVQNNSRVQPLNFTTTSVLFNKNTKQNDGTALSALSEVVTNDWIVRLEIQAFGQVNIESGEISVTAGAVDVVSIQNAAGQMLDLTAGAAAAFAAEIRAGALVGYDVQAYRTNVNRRQAGQFIDVSKYTQLYNVPLRAPITTKHPATTDGTTDASDVQALIIATRIRVSNEAVSSLLRAAEQLSRYVDSRDASGNGPDVLGVGRFFVRPAYRYDSLDMLTVVDSQKSHERSKDLQAALIDKLRDMAYRLYRDSEYKAAADALSGGISAVPEVIIGTDPVLARYISVEGDLRTLGGEFNVRVVSTLDSRMEGKIFMAFGVMDESRNAQPNPLNFGNMVWAPELVLTANLTRGNAYSRETVVQPRYLFVVNTPILGMMEVSNIEGVLNKVPALFKSI